MRPMSLRAMAVIILLLAEMAFAGTPNRVTILYDSFGKSRSLTMDWGFAALVEYGGKRILFDTGNNSQILEHNVKAAGVDLQKLDFVVMSHRHGDHMGGLAYLLKVNPTVKIYAQKERSGVYGDDQPSSTWYRKDESLPVEQRYYKGAPPEIIHMGAAWPDTNFQLIDKKTEIAPGMFLIALVSDQPGTLEVHELSLAIRTPDGGLGGCLLPLCCGLGGCPLPVQCLQLQTSETFFNFGSKSVTSKLTVRSPSWKGVNSIKKVLALVSWRAKVTASGAKRALWSVDSVHFWRTGLD